MIKKGELIPVSTEISGRRINISWDTPRVIEQRLYGTINIITGELHLANKIGETEIPLEEKEITYLHEIFHFILKKGGYESKLEEAGINLERLVEDLGVGMYECLTKASNENT